MVASALSIFIGRVFCVWIRKIPLSSVFCACLPIWSYKFQISWFSNDFPQLGIGAEVRKIFLQSFRAKNLAFFRALLRYSLKPLLAHPSRHFLDSCQGSARAEKISLSEKLWFPGLRKYIILISLVVRIAHKLESPNLAASNYYQSENRPHANFRVYQNYRGRSISATWNFDRCQEIR